VEKLTADIEENASYTPTLCCDNQGGLDWMKDVVNMSAQRE
jgi:hypothetical protein